MSNNKKFDINACFADDANTFWEVLEEWNNCNVFCGVYSCLYDPDGHSNMLYEFHECLWNKQRDEMKSKLPKTEKNSNELKLPEIEINSHTLKQIGNNNFSLSSDSIINIYFHRWCMQPLLQKIADYPVDDKNVMDTEIEKMEAKFKDKIAGRKGECFYNKNWDKTDYKNKLKKFFWLYLQKSNTIGGFVVFPRHNYSINQGRGILSKINDRFDLTLECIRRYYIYLKNPSEKSDNPLFNYLDKDKAFFEMFGSFENYVDFFCLQSWVDDEYKVYDLLGDTPTTLLNADVMWKENKIIPCDFKTEDEKVEKWWNLYHNLMDRLEKRNERIASILSK